MSGDCCDKFRSKVCKIRIATLVSESIIVVVLLLEVLVGAELAEEGEKYVQRFYNRLSILKLMHGDVAHRANNLGIVGGVHINFGTGERSRFESCLHLGRPLLH